MEKLTRHIGAVHPALVPALRAFLVGYAASVGPALLKVLLATAKGKGGVSKVFAALRAGFVLSGLGVCAAVSVGGAKLGEASFEPLVRAFYMRSLDRHRQKRAAKLGKLSKDAAELQADAHAHHNRVHERKIKALATFCASSVSSLLAIILLQSGPTYARRRPPRTEGSSRYDYLVQESPTLDLTLFLLVRAVDSVVRGAYEVTDKLAGRRGKVVDFLASQADTIVFWLSCWRIMWCWFYLDSRLPPSYVRWICGLARGDPALMAFSRLANNGGFVYGQALSKGTAEVYDRMSKTMQNITSSTAPLLINEKVPCSVLHGTMNTESCEVNAIKRWGIGFVDSFKIYGPVHLLPSLLFRPAKFLSTPFSSILHVLVAASWSSAFLTTFITSIYASICLSRTKLGPALGVSQQFLDGGFSVGLGCFMCGFSVLFEQKRRRREMGLYVLPRALYSVMDDIIPSILLRGVIGEFFTRWIERLIFALSTGVVTTATIYRPDLVSGLIRGVMSMSVGKQWHPVIKGASVMAGGLKP